MSCLPQVNVLESSQIKSYKLLTEAAHSPVTSEEVKLHTRRDSIMSEVLDLYRMGGLMPLLITNFNHIIAGEESSVFKMAVLFGETVLLYHLSYMIRCWRSFMLPIWVSVE